MRWLACTRGGGGSSHSAYRPTYSEGGGGGGIEEPTISGVYQESSSIRPMLHQVFARQVFRVSYEW